MTCNTHWLAFRQPIPYTELGKSYERLFAYLHEKGLKAQLPSREVYLKGPGMLFRGNPRKYLTEIQVRVG